MLPATSHNTAFWIWRQITKGFCKQLSPFFRIQQQFFYPKNNPRYTGTTLMARATGEKSGGRSGCIEFCLWRMCGWLQTLCFQSYLLRWTVFGWYIFWGVQSYLLTFGVWKPNMLDASNRNWHVGDLGGTLPIRSSSFARSIFACYVLIIYVHLNKTRWSPGSSEWPFWGLYTWPFQGLLVTSIWVIKESRTEKAGWYLRGTDAVLISLNFSRI